LKNNAPAIPPKTAAEIADAPSTPSADRTGVPEPLDGFASVASIALLASSSVSSSVPTPVSPPQPTLPMYCA